LKRGGNGDAGVPHGWPARDGRPIGPVGLVGLEPALDALPGQERGNGQGVHLLLLNGGRNDSGAAASRDDAHRDEP
jgi:hypothetical protein